MKKVISVVVGTALIGTILTGCGAKSTKNEVAEVYSKPIYKTAYKTAFLVSMLQAQQNSTTSIWDAVADGKKATDQIRDYALNLVIDNKVLTVKANDMKVKLTKADNKNINTIYNNAVKGFSVTRKAEFEDGLKRISLNKKDFNKELKDLVKGDSLSYELYKKMLKDYKFKVTDSAIKKDYIKTNETVKAKHILISFSKHSDKDALKIANEVIAKLKAGGNFAELAKKYSEDPGSASSGGDLGAAFKRGAMVKEFENAAFSTKVGQYTTKPVKSTYGYHIILVEQHNTPDVAKISAQTKKQVSDEMKTTAFNTYFKNKLEKWRKDAKIKKIDTKLPVKTTKTTSTTGTSTTNTTK